LPYHPRDINKTDPAVQHHDTEAWDQVWTGANIATMVDGGDPYGALTDAAMAVRGERIAWIGPTRQALPQAKAVGACVHDAAGLWITPGLIDCHTHLVYGGDRVAEYEMRLKGASYEQIARAGGGIQSTVAATRAAGLDELRASAELRARRLMAEGVTTLEIKSGYGLDLANEQRMLEVARRLGRDLALSVRTTFLGLHALPIEYSTDRQAYVDAVSGPWLETLAAARLVDAVDAFCEDIAFTVAEAGQFLRAAARLNLPAHVHAGQLSDLGAAELAADVAALSADHLEYLSAGGAAALKKSGTVAVLLPCAYYMLRQTVPPPLALLRDTGVPVAVATDCNPGTSPCTSLLLAMSMACTLFGLTPEEALAGVTRNAARALGLQGDRGTLEIGRRADFALWRIGRPAELCYALGANPLAGVVFGGQSRVSDMIPPMQTEKPN
jgi:imidazolonepropionase